MSAQQARLQLELEKVQSLYRQVQETHKILQEKLHQLKSKSTDVVALFKQVLPSVVSIYALDWETETELATGSGFFVAPDIIVTNYRIVQGIAEEDSYFEEEESQQVLVGTYDGEIRLAEVVFTGNLEEDLTLLLIGDSIVDPTTGQEVDDPKEYQPLELLFDSQLGENVIALGTAFGKFSATVTEGIITTIREPDEPKNGEIDQVAGLKLLQTTATINPGNSGGPLINLAGQVVGVNVWEWQGTEGINCAIASESLDDFLAGFEATIEGDSEDDFE